MHHCPPARYLLIGMAFVGWFNILLLRTNVSTAIVFMVNNSGSTENATSFVTNDQPDQCTGDNSTTTTNLKPGPFNWNSMQQGLVLGCYYYGYIFTGLPSAWIAQRVGFKHVIGYSVALSSILTILSPLAAHTAIELFIACRILIGVFQGCVIPVTVSSFATWIPPKEKNVAFALLMCGFLFGAFATLPLTTLIAQFISWEAIFYITGSFTLIWSTLWCVLIYNSPDEHPWISVKEKNYLKKFSIVATTEKTKTVPWRSILTSLPVWVAILSHFAYDWTFATAGLLLPTYMSTIVKLDMTAAGIWSGFPYLVMIVVVLSSSAISESIRQRRPTISLTVIRKIFVTFALIGPAICTVLAAYAGCNEDLMIFFFIVSVGFLGFHVVGTEANYFDLSPPHCGIIFGFSALIATTAGFIAPQVAGYILYQDSSAIGWRKFFWITAGVNACTCVLFLMFGSAEEQSWSKSSINKYAKSLKDQACQEEKTNFIRKSQSDNLSQSEVL